MPPSLVEWLPEDHLVWTVLGAVDQMDLDRFNEAYRLGGAGVPAYDPAMSVALLLYSYARGNRSSRGIERACFEDVACKVICAMRTPDHSTIAEFRRRHEADIKELFDDVLGLCREAGLVSVGVITIDGTKIKADASMDQNRSYRDLVTQILREAEEIDQAEDRLHGKDRRGDELPEELRTPEGRRQALADAKRRLEERKGRAIKACATADPEMDLEPLVLGRQVLRRGGRREWPRVARRELEAHRAQLAQPIPRDREDRLFQALDRLEQNHRVELAAHEDYDRWRALGTGHQRAGVEGQHQTVHAGGDPGGRDQPLRSRRESDAHTGHAAASGLQRADQRERAAGHPRCGDHCRRAGLRTSGADARHHPRSISPSMA